ncbi:hypothetical protein ACHWQZ_G004148 [Mnemiopsis leidyi]
MNPFCAAPSQLSGPSLCYLLLALNLLLLTDSSDNGFYSQNLPTFDDDGGFYESSEKKGTYYDGGYRNSRDDIFTPIELLEVENIAKSMSEQLMKQFEDRTKFSTLSEDLMSIPFDITDGEDTLTMVQEHVEQTLELARKMLIGIRKEAQEAFEMFTRDNVHGFDFVDQFSNHSAIAQHEVEYYSDYKFQRPVNLRNSSVTLPLEVYYNWTDVRRTIQWTEKLDDIFKKNERISRTGFYQHFSTPEGVMRSYPSVYTARDESWTFYDPRQRTWYTTGSMEPKSIVFLVDGSGSIYGESNRLLKETVKNVLHSLVSDLDYMDVAMVRENQVSSLVECEGRKPRLRRTTQATKSYLAHKIENEEWYGLSNVTRGFEYAFDLLKEYKHSTCHKLVVLFTDYTNEELIPYIEQRDDDLGGGTHVVIFTFGYEGWIRQNLSKVAEHFEGYSVKINDLPQIFTAARGITNVFTSKGVRERSLQFPFSNSYQDGYGQGYIVTLLLPVLSRGPPPPFFPHTKDGSFLGVAGIDLPTRIFGEFSLSNQQGCFTLAVNARGYVVYHPLFSELEMGEVDVKYHQFSYLANSDDEITIENVLVYQNFTGTLKTHSTIFGTKFRSPYITQYNVFITPVKLSDFSLALLCPNQHQITKWPDETLFRRTLSDILDDVEIRNFDESHHCRYRKILQESMKQNKDRTLGNFYNFINNTFHTDCANSILQILYEVWKFKKLNLVHGSFIVTASGNRYIQDGMRLIRHSGPETQGLYNYLSAVATPHSPLVLLDRGETTFTLGRVVVHHSGVPMAIVGFNISTYLIGATLQRVLGKTDIQRHNTYVLDQSGYIVYSNRARTVGNFIGQVEPCALDLMEKSRVYTYHKEGQCFHLCEREPVEDSSVSSSAVTVWGLLHLTLQLPLSSSSLLPLLLLSLLDRVVSHEKLQCCKYKLFYQRDDEYPLRSEVLRAGCLEYLVVPIEQTNLLLLVAPDKPDCPCISSPITLDPPAPTFAGPCNTNDKNYNSRYVCSEEIELDHEPQGGGRGIGPSSIFILFAILVGSAAVT